MLCEEWTGLKFRREHAANVKDKRRAYLETVTMTSEDVLSAVSQRGAFAKPIRMYEREWLNLSFPAPIVAQPMFSAEGSFLSSSAIPVSPQQRGYDATSASASGYAPSPQRSKAMADVMHSVDAVLDAIKRMAARHAE